MKHNKYFYILLVTVCAVIIAVWQYRNNALIELQGFAQGTTYHIHFVAKHISAEDIRRIDQEIKQELLRLDKSISNYRNDSDIEKFNAKKTTEPIDTSEEIVSLIEIARKVSTASHGCYDLTIKPLFDLWGFKSDHFHFPSESELSEQVKLLGMNQLETLSKNQLRKMNPQLQVDLSSIGQGYSISRITNILERHHLHNYMVEIGGELKVKGKKQKGDAWRVALEKPISTERKIEKIIHFNSGESMSLMPSGTYHHFFDENGKRYSHILDARTGTPIEHTTVMANAFLEDSTQADAWSTALLCLGSREGLKVANENNIAALFIDERDGKFIEAKSTALMALKGLSLEEPRSP